MVVHDTGVLVIDESTLDNPYSHQIDMVTRHWNGKYHRVVQGINLISTIWTDGTAIVPAGFRVYYPEKDGKNKTTILGIWSGQLMNESFNQIAFSLIHGIRVSTTWNWFGLWNGTGVLASNPTDWWIRIIHIIVKSRRLTYPLKVELFTCANMVPSRFSDCSFGWRSWTLGNWYPRFIRTRQKIIKRSRVEHRSIPPWHQAVLWPR